MLGLVAIVGVIGVLVAAAAIVWTIRFVLHWREGHGHVVAHWGVKEQHTGTSWWGLMFDTDQTMVSVGILKVTLRSKPSQPDAAGQPPPKSE